MKAAVIALVAVIFAMMSVLMGAVALASMFAGGSFSLTGTAYPIGPPVNIGVVKAPANIVTLDEAVATGQSFLVPCPVSASILLAQQYYESGYNPTAHSSAGAVGLAQFEPGTFAEYNHPTPPGGSTPPSPLNPVDSAWAEARYLCSLGVDTNATNALIAYNCGNISSACVAASSGYAQEILTLASKIAAKARKGTIITSIGAVI